MELLLEAERQGLIDGQFVFFIVQHFEVSGNVVSKIYNLATGNYLLKSGVGLKG